MNNIYEITLTDGKTTFNWMFKAAQRHEAEKKAYYRLADEVRDNFKITKIETYTHLEGQIFN